MKARTAGGVGIGLVALGLLLGLLWKGPGLGGAGVGEGEQGQAAPDLVGVSSSVSSPTAASAAPVGDRRGQEDFVTVVIDGDGYRLTSADNTEGGTEASLDQIVERVKKVSGTPEGIRLRVLLQRSAQEGARSDLQAALRSAGVRTEEIQEVTEFLK